MEFVDIKTTSKNGVPLLDDIVNGLSHTTKTLQVSIRRSIETNQVEEPSAPITPPHLSMKPITSVQRLNLSSIVYNGSDLTHMMAKLSKLKLLLINYNKAKIFNRIPDNERNQCWLFQQMSPISSLMLVECRRIMYN